jgi:hypothetical protein
MTEKTVFIASVANTLGSAIDDNIFHIRHYDISSLNYYLNIQKNEHIRFTYQENNIISDKVDTSNIVIILSKNSERISRVDKILPFQVETESLNDLFLPAAFFISSHTSPTSNAKVIPLTNDISEFIFWGPYLPLPLGFWHVEFIFNYTTTITYASAVADRRIMLDIASHIGEIIHFSVILMQSELLTRAHALLHVQSPDDIFEFRAYYIDTLSKGQAVSNLVFTGVKLTRATEQEFTSQASFLLQKSDKDKIKGQLRNIFKNFRALTKIILQSADKIRKDKVNPYIRSRIKSLLSGRGDVTRTQHSVLNSENIKINDEFEDYMNKLSDINLEQTNHCAYKCIFCNRDSMTRKKGL